MRSQGETYKAASKEGWQMARDVARGVLTEMAERDPQAVTIDQLDSDDLQDTLDTDVDDALIYTADQWVCALGLPDADEEYYQFADTASGDFDKLLAAKAYCNLKQEVERYLNPTGQTIAEVLERLKCMPLMELRRIYE